MNSILIPIPKCHIPLKRYLIIVILAFRIQEQLCESLSYLDDGDGLLGCPDGALVEARVHEVLKIEDKGFE